MSFVLDNAVLDNCVMGSTSIAETHVEMFLDEANIDTYSGVSFGVNTPTKYGSNPVGSDVFNDATAYDKYGLNDVGLIVDPTNGKKIRIWYQGKESYIDSSKELHACFAYSADGLTWLRPNLGLSNYGGNTNNNIIIRDYVVFKHAIKCSNLTYPYLAVVRYKTPASKLTETAKDNDYGYHGIWGSSDETDNWAWIKSIADTGQYECKSLIEKADGTFILYDRRNVPREIGAYSSDTTDPTGAWSDEGIIISANGDNEQRYTFTAYLEHNDLYLGFCGFHNDSTRQNYAIGLYVSRDGLTWTSKNPTFIEAGASSAWDDGMVFPIANPVRFDNEWFFYYYATDTLHPKDPEYPNTTNYYWNLGISKIGYRRLGYISGTGSLITNAITQADRMTLNGNGTGGDIDVELLDPSDDSILTGYSKSDFDTITSDVYSHRCTWNGSQVLPSQNVKIKIYSDGGTVYSFSLGDI